MGRILDLFADVAAAMEEGMGGLVLPPEDRERLLDDWSDEEIEDAVEMVKDNLLQSELASAADSLSARMVEVLGEFGTDEGYAQLEKGEARLGLMTAAQLARRVHRLEEILEVYRDDAPPARENFDALRARIADHGIEEPMTEGRLAHPEPHHDHGPDADEEDEYKD